MDIESLDDLRRSRGPMDPALLKKALADIEKELPLAALRKSAGVTQAEMAKRLGKSQAAISKFEGRGDFLCSTLFRYAQSLGADVELKINVAGKKFSLSSREDEGNLYFLLNEDTAHCDAVSAHVEKVVSILAFAANRKRKIRPSFFDRAVQKPTTEKNIDADLFDLEVNYC